MLKYEKNKNQFRTCGLQRPPNWAEKPPAPGALRERGRDGLSRMMGAPAPMAPAGFIIL